MAVERVWFPHVPDGTISASDRARQAIGYGGIAIAALIILNLENAQIKNNKQGFQIKSTKQSFQIKNTQ
jgi:hypothetical protein